MSIEAKMSHIPPHLKNGNDLRVHCRAQIDGGSRPCLYYAVEGHTLCEMHGGVFEQYREENRNHRSYQLAKWRTELDRFGNSDSLKSLREEIAIARLTLQGILKQCENEYDLMLNSGKIALLLDKVQALVINCNRLEDRLGLVLDKSAIINLAESIVQIIAGHGIDPEIVEQVATQISEAVEASGRVALKSN